MTDFGSRQQGKPRCLAEILYRRISGEQQQNCKFVTLLSLARNWVDDASGNFPEKEDKRLEARGPLPETRTAAIPSDGFDPIISRKQKGEKL